MKFCIQIINQKYKLYAIIQVESDIEIYIILYNL